MQGAAGQAEVITRNLAEGGMKRLFRLIANCIISNANKEEIIRLNNKFVAVDPRTWNADADIVVNVGVGNGREQEKAAVLRETLQMQMSVWQQYGVNNGLVTMTNVRNTLTDLLASVGLKNSDRYYLPVTMESEQELIAQKQQQAQMNAANQSDPNQVFMAAEAMKTQTKAQVDIAKLQLDAQKNASDKDLEMHKLAMQDDLKRDELIQQLMLRVAEIEGKYAQSVDTQLIKSEQDAIRPHNEEMLNGLQEASY